MALEKAEGSLEKVAMGIHEREKEGINKISALAEITDSMNQPVLKRSVGLCKTRRITPKAR